MVRRCTAVFALTLLAFGDLAGQSKAAPYAGPIIDVHLHTDPPQSVIGVPNPVSGVKPPATSVALRDAILRECKKYNITRGILNGYPETLEAWVAADPERFIPAPMIFKDKPEPTLDIPALRQAVKSGQAGALGEIIAQYVGLAPDAPVLEPYWALAEELDIPVMVHMGTSFPGTAYSGYPAFRLRLGNPMLLEDVLVKHPRLRVWVAHGGLPWSQEMFALMQQYPQLYMDVATINWIGGAPGRPAFHAFLREAIGRGFGKRIMFGSDAMAWPDAIGLAIEGVNSASFLTAQQKRDIFCENARAVFRFKEEVR